MKNRFFIYQEPEEIKNLAQWCKDNGISRAGFYSSFENAKKNAKEQGLKLTGFFYKKMWVGVKDIK